MNGLVPTLTAGMDHGNTMPYIVAMRGRDKLNPSHRGKATENYEQRLEINMSNCTNTLTSVQKDNLVLEKILTEETDRVSSLSRAEQSRAEQSSLIYIRQATKRGIIEMEIPGIADLSYPTSEFRRGRVQGKGKISPTLMTEAIPSVLEDWVWEIDGELYLIRIRKLTPRECWRLMSFNDSDFDKAEEVMSNSSLYKQAGNSIVTDVLCAIFKEML